MNEEELKGRLFEHVYPIYKESLVWQSIYGSQAKELALIEMIQEDLEAQLDLERATWALTFGSKIIASSTMLRPLTNDVDA